MAETYLPSIRQSQTALGGLDSVSTYSILNSDKEATREPMDYLSSSPCNSYSVQRNRSTPEKASKTDPYNGSSSVTDLKERYSS